MTNPHELAGAKRQAAAGVTAHLNTMLAEGKLTEEFHAVTLRNVTRYLGEWLDDPELDRLSPNLKRGILGAIEQERWIDIVNAFARRTSFGTGGIRALMSFDRSSIVRLKEEGLDAPILKGENTINNIVLMRAARGIAAWMNDHYGDAGARRKAVVGCDSRIRGLDLAKCIAEVFLAEGLEVYLFDDPMPYPEITFTIPWLDADIGVFISASHNDYRYNGFKLSGPSGAQISKAHRDMILEKINETTFDKIRTTPFETLAAASDPAMERLHFMGGAEPLPRDYFGREGSLLDVHQAYADQLESFFLNKELLGESGAAADLKIVFSAFNGAGRSTVPRILTGMGFTQLYSIRSLFDIDGLFPAFKSDPGEEQQPDPGDPRAAAIALAELEKDVISGATGCISWADADIMIGTDPDADRCGVIVKPPVALAKRLVNHPSPRYSAEHMLIPADDMWALILWYRLEFGDASRRDREFVALSHTTSDVICDLCRKHGLGIVKTWVGFAWLSTAVMRAWEGSIPEGIREGYAPGQTGTVDMVFHDTTLMNAKRKLNFATLEQSNGFSILGGPPPSDRDLGEGGHVRDKDGTLAAILTAEIACFAKSNGTDILSLLVEHIYGDPDVGLYVNYYEPDPLDGEYPGVEGDTKKKSILKRTAELFAQAASGKLVIGGRRVSGTSEYWTGKYDTDVNGKHFVDEGYRFFLGRESDHLTVRPSGTTNSLRFHVQLHGGTVKEQEAAWDLRLELEREAKGIVDDIRDLIGAPRVEGAIF